MCQVEEEERKVRGSFLSLGIDQTIMRKSKTILWEPKEKKKEKEKERKKKGEMRNEKCGMEKCVCVGGGGGGSFLYF